MNDTIIKDSLKVVSEIITKSIASESNEHINWWLWIAIIEFVFIMFLVIKQKIKQQKEKLREVTRSPFAQGFKKYVVTSDLVGTKLGGTETKNFKVGMKLFAKEVVVSKGQWVAVLKGFHPQNWNTSAAQKGDPPND